MDYIQDRSRHIDISLQNSRVCGIKFHNKTLTFKLDRIFRRVEGEEAECPGEFRFEACDLDLCRALIFNKTLGEGRFTGKALSLREFMDVYGNAEFEIVTEGYFGNTTTYSGWLWEAEKSTGIRNPVSLELRGSDLSNRGIGTHLVFVRGGEEL